MCHASQAVEHGSATEASLDLSSYTGAPAGVGIMAADLSSPQFSRPAPYPVRRPQQLQFPPFPTTTIGSFPQTPAIRRARLQYKKGAITAEQYNESIAAEIG